MNKTINKKYLYIIGFVFVSCTFNNILITVSSVKGKTLLFSTGGLLGLNGSKRSSSFAGQALGLTLGKKLLFLGIRFLYIKLNGFGNARKPVLKGLVASSLKIIALKDQTVIPHNGCKLKKQRRI
jgi:small subunit ribosomal protein S11